MAFGATLCAVVLIAGTAHAYPSSVVFAPTGESRAFGEVGLFGYTSWVLHRKVAPGVTWFGLQVGVVPKIAYRDGGPSFGGVEVGTDLFASDLPSTPDTFVKPVANVKVQPLTQWGALPSVALGVMGVSPFRRERSLDMVYGSLTRSLAIAGRDYGKLTLGFAGILGPRGDDPYRESLPVFRGSWPFASRARMALLGGWSSPSFGPLSLAIDHIGGVSELSSTNVALSLTPAPGATWAVGGWVVTDRASYASGAFTYLAIDWSIPRTFG